MRGDTDRAAEPATPTADAGARDARRVSVARVWLCLWLDDWPSGVVCASSVTCGRTVRGRVGCRVACINYYLCFLSTTREVKRKFGRERHDIKP